MGQFINQGLFNQPNIPLWLSLAVKFYPALLGYAVLYMGFPLMRIVINKKTNYGIMVREARRKEWTDFLKSKDVRISRKLAAAVNLAVKLAPVISSQNNEEIDIKS